MIRIKPGVVMTGIAPEVVLGLYVLDRLYEEAGFSDMWVTSALDGVHSHTSLHYSGNAVDTDAPGIPNSVLQDIANEASERLGRDYDVLYEGHSPHIHLEYQPRKP